MNKTTMQLRLLYILGISILLHFRSYSTVVPFGNCILGNIIDGIISLLKKATDKVLTIVNHQPMTKK